MIRVLLRTGRLRLVAGWILVELPFIGLRSSQATGDSREDIKINKKKKLLILALTYNIMVKSM